MDNRTDKSCVPMTRSHFNGNGSCDARREANKRADHATGYESEIAPYTAAELQSMQSAGGYGQMTTRPHEAEHDMITDGYGTEHPREDEQLDGMTSIPQDSFNTPLNADEAARNSWRALLARNVGRNVLVRFLMGTQNMVTVEGELYEVGTDYIVIYQPLWDSHITADLYSVKFVEFREPPGVVTLD